MRRLILTTMAAALVAATPIAAAWAQGQGNGRGGHEQRGGGWRGDRGGPGPRFERPRGGEDRRFERARPHQMRRDRGPERRYDRPRMLRPGGHLPGAYRDDRVENYGRYRLRPPPQGYDWYRVGDGFLLVAPDGQIFDVIVD